MTSLTQICVRAPGAAAPSHAELPKTFQYTEEEPLIYDQ